MRKLLLILLLALASSANAAWYIGNWIVDEDTTKNTLGEDYESLAGLAVAIMKKIDISITKSEIIISQQGKTKTTPYSEKIVDNNIVFLDTGNKTTSMRVGKDKNGMYMLGEKRIKMGDEPANVTEFKIYLMPSNNQIKPTLKSRAAY